MIQLNSSEHAIEMSTPAQIVPVTSGVSPWLVPLAYSLAHHVIMPLHFKHLEITGHENLPTTGPVILAPTHRARWDAVVVPYVTGRLVTGRDLRFMVSANEMKGIQGWIIRRCGGFPVDTEQPGIGSFRHGVEILRKSEMLVVFPEGGIFRDGCVHPLKRGLARMALHVEADQPGLGVKIVPISIRYGQAFPSWGSDVRVNIGSPLEVTNYASKSPKRSAQKLTADLEAALIKLDGSQPSAVTDDLSEANLQISVNEAANAH